MAELHVGAAFALRTLAQAVAVAKAGDVVIVHAGTYRETLKLPAGTTWQAAPGEERPVIDGGWNGKSLKGKAGGPAVVHFNAPGATMDSFRIVNGKSTGVGVSADGAVLRNCSVDNSYATGVVVNAGEDVTGVVIEDCDIRRSIMKWPVDGLVGGAALALIGAVGAVVRGCTIMGSWGEGIDVGKGSRGVTVEGCTIGATAHVGLYIVRATDTTLRNNVIFQPTEGTDEEAFRVKPGRVASGIIIGDEASEAAQRYKVHSARSCVEGNVVVNCLALFHARCRLPQSDTSLDDGTRVAGNTFIAGPHTEWGLRVGEEPTNPHGAAIFEKNLIIMDAAPVGVPMAEAADGGDGWKLVWRKNGWTSQPPALFRGAGDVLVPAGTLANAGARIAGTWQGADISIDNYRPVAGGPLDGAGVGALEPLPVEPPPVVDPPPPEPSPTPAGPDWDALRVLAVTAAQQLVSARANVTEAQKHTDGAAVLLNLSMLRLADARQAQTDAMTQVAALLAALNEAAKPAAK